MAGVDVGDDVIRPNFNRKNQQRGVVIRNTYKWPNNIIPYDISSISGWLTSFFLDRFSISCDFHRMSFFFFYN